MTDRGLSREAFDTLVELSGLPLDEDKRAELYEACGHLERMKARVREGAADPRELEPAHVFAPLGRHPGR